MLINLPLWSLLRFEAGEQALGMWLTTKTLSNCNCPWIIGSISTVSLAPIISCSQTSLAEPHFHVKSRRSHLHIDLVLIGPGISGHFNNGPSPTYLITTYNSFADSATSTQYALSPLSLLSLLSLLSGNRLIWASLSEPYTSELNSDFVWHT